MNELNIGINHAGSPQAKGRVERSNKTHQDRLVKMLRLENISSIEEANAYLQNVYMPLHNKKFAVEAENLVDMHRPTKGYDLDNILCFKEERVMPNDRTIMYKTRYLQLHADQKTLIFPKNTITVHEHLDGALRLFMRNMELNFTELTERPKKQIIEKIRKVPHFTKPAANHPWRGNKNYERSDVGSAQ